MGHHRPALVVVLALAGCGDAVFACTDDASCDAGYCEPTGYCSFDDPACASGRRYGARAGDDLAGTCVAGGDTDGDASTGPTTTAGSQTASASTGASATTEGSSGPDPVTTTPVSTMTAVDESSSSPTVAEGGESESSSGPAESTGVPSEITVSFGDRFDADFQDVTHDTSLLNYAIADNMGLHTDLHLDGNEFGSWQVTLLRFDVSALPPDAAVVGVTLRLWSYDLFEPGAIDVLRVTEAWAEGDGDHSPGICNWIDRLDGVPWTVEGAGEGSHDPTVLASFAVDEAWSSFDIELPPELVTGWRDDPGENFGMLLRTLDFAAPLYIPSSEEPDESLRPLLLVTYAP